MSLNFELSVLFFPALLLVTCNSFSLFGSSCYQKFPKHDLSKLDANSIVKDVDGFYDDFDKRYQELKMFIKNNMSQSDSVDVQFFLFTQDNQKKPDHLSKTSLKKSHFNYKNPVKVLVHGLQPLGETDHPINNLKHALLYNGKFNVIVMRYEKVGQMPYTEALKYSYLVAKKSADFLQTLLKTFKITANRLHLIGYEFGGQLVGNMGSHIPGLARISALDPAGALFHRFPPKYRLSKDDAIFVDVIHTSTRPFPRGLGIEMPVGHQDFYPNGGKHQPGCKDNITAEMAGGRDAAEFKNAICSNERAVELYVESVCDQYCTGRECDSYIDYEKSDCLLSSQKTMGFHAKKSPGKESKKHSKYYLDTNEKHPFCSFL